MPDTITLRDFANGDTDYVAKLNANNAALADAIDALLAANGGSTGTLLSMGMLLLGLMRSGVVRLGTDGFGYIIVGETLVMDGGDAWRGESVRVMQSLGGTLDFSTKTPGTWYIELADDGSLAIAASTASPVYSVVWTGSAFGAITLLAQTLFSSADETATLFSVIKNVLYATLEARLEALEVGEPMAADDTGTANAYKVTLPEVAAYRKYLVVIFQAAHANTGASTLEVLNGAGSLGVKALDKSGSSALSSGDIPAGATIVAIYDGVDFQIIAGAGSSGAVTAVSATEPVVSSGGTTPDISLGITNGLKLDGSTPKKLEADIGDGLAFSSNTIVANLGAGLALDSSSPKKITAPAMVGDSGSGGTAGIVPAPPAGSAAAGKFLKADGTFEVPAGSGGTVTSVTGTEPITSSGGATPAIGIGISDGLDLDSSSPKKLIVGVGAGLSLDSSSPKKITAPAMVGDSGSGGAAGIVPAPPAGSAAAGKFLKADGTFAVPPGTGTGTVTAVSASYPLASSGGATPNITANPMVGFIVNDGSTGTNVGPILIARQAGQVIKCKIVTKASDPAIDLTFKIKKNGTDVFSADPTITHGTGSGTITTSTSLTSVPLSVAADDLFTIDITSGSGAWQFTAQLE